MDIEQEIKIYWILGIIVLLIYGLWLFISPESYAVATNWPYFAPSAGRIVGSLYLTWVIILIRLFKERDNWEKIEEWMLFAVISNILTIISSIIVIVVYNTPIMSSVVGMILNIFFAIVGIHIIMQKRK